MHIQQIIGLAAARWKVGKRWESPEGSAKNFATAVYCLPGFSTASGFVRVGNGCLSVGGACKKSGPRTPTTSTGVPGKRKNGTDPGIKYRSCHDDQKAEFPVRIPHRPARMRCLGRAGSAVFCSRIGKSSEREEKSRTSIQIFKTGIGGDTRLDQGLPGFGLFVIRVLFDEAVDSLQCGFVFLVSIVVLFCFRSCGSFLVEGGHSLPVCVLSTTSDQKQDEQGTDQKVVLVIHESPIQRMFCLRNVSARVQFNFPVFPKKMETKRSEAKSRCEAFRISCRRDSGAITVQERGSCQITNVDICCRFRAG